MSSRKSEPPPPKRTPPVRTEQVGSCVFDAPVAASLRTGESVQNAPDELISRTEHTTSAAPIRRAPLDLYGLSRVLTASILDASLSRHWESREAWASNRCIAEHYCENTESVIRRWRSGEKSIPLAALHILPATLAEELAREVLAARGVDLRQSMSSLRESVARIEKPVSADDREEVAKGLREARDRIIARLDRLATEGK